MYGRKANQTPKSEPSVYTVVLSFDLCFVVSLCDVGRLGDLGGGVFSLLWALSVWCVRARAAAGAGRARPYILNIVSRLLYYSKCTYLR
jgi:hypothetical protein